MKSERVVRTDAAVVEGAAREEDEILVLVDDEVVGL